MTAPNAAVSIAPS